MAQQAPDTGSVDEVQIFDADEVLKSGRIRDAAANRLGMAISPNSEIVGLETPARGEMQLAADPEADHILLVLKGSCTVAGLSSEQVLAANQGLLIPAGVGLKLVSTTDEALVSILMRTESAEGRPGFVPNTPSGVRIKVPAAEISAKGLGRFLYVFALNRQTLGVGVGATEEWNLGSLVRMNCEYEQSGDYVLVNLPERIARWYRLRDLTESDYRIIPDPERTRVRVDLSPLGERTSRR